MKQAIIITAFITISAISAFGQSTSGLGTEKDKSDVIALSKDFANALLARDSAKLEGILAPDYGDISTVGFPTTRTLLLGAVKSYPSNITLPKAIKFDDDWTFARVHGDAAVVITKIKLEWPSSKEEIMKRWPTMLPEGDEYVVTLVAARDSGKWQIVSTQESPMAWKVVESK